MKNFIAGRHVSQFRPISVFLLVLAHPCFGQQSQPGLQITSPADGTVVNTGEMLSVTVTSPVGLTFAYIGVIGPGGPVGSNTSAPITFSITIPTNTVPRKYALTAVGRVSGAPSVFSKAVSIRIERPDTPTRLANDLPAIPFQAPGDFEYLRISGTFPDGSVVNVTESTYLSFSSSNTSVATVNAKGLVRAVGPGRAIIEAAYSGGPRKGVPVSVANGPLKPSPTSLSFGSQNIGTVSGSQSVTLTNSTNNASLGITRVTASGDFSEADNCVSSSPLAVGATCTVNVAFAPTATGSREGYLNLQTNMISSPVGIPLSGTGTEDPSGPTIANLSPTSGPVGTSVSISGTNFGSAQGASVVSFNGTLAQASTWGATGIVVPVPAGATTGHVTVTVANQLSNGASFIVSTPSPTLSGLSPPSGPVGTSVTITGANFGASQATSTVGFHGALANPTNWSANSITAPVPSSATSGDVYVTVAGQPSNGLSFAVTPTITSLTPTSGTAGTSVTISGTGFGPTQGTSIVAFNGAAATPTNWSPTSIAASAPSGATTGNVVVTVGGIPSNGVNFTVPGTGSSSNVSVVQHNSIDAGTTSSSSLAFNANNTAGYWTAVCVRAGNSGQTITVTDSNGNTYHPAVQFNVSADPPAGDTLGIFYAESIAGGPNTVTVSIATAASLRFAILEYSGIASSNSLDQTAASQGTSASPSSGTTTTTSNGDLLLGAILSGDAVNFTAGPGYTIEDSVPAPSNAKLIVEDENQTMAGATSASATLNVSTAWGAALATFKSAPPPTINGLSPTSGAAGTLVTISGSNFGSAQGNGTVTFNGTAVTPTSWSSTSISVPVPTGSATGNLVVTVFGISSNGLNFTVNPGQIALVQHASVDAPDSASSSLAFNSSNTAGNWIGVCIRAGAQGETFTVTDSSGNTYHQAAQLSDTLDTPSGNTIAIFYAENIAGGANTVTVSDTISGTLRFAILEYAGIATSNSLDITAGTQGSSASPNSGSATTSANGDLLLGAVATADAETFTGGPGYSVKEFVPAEPATKLMVEDWIQMGAGSVSARAALGAGDPWGALIAAFKPANTP